MEVELDGLFRQNISYDYDDNYEYKDDVDQRRASGVWIQILYSLLTVLGLLGNGLLIGAFSLKRKSRNSWTVSDIFIFNQGFADVLLLVTLPFWAVQASRPCGSCFTGVLCRISGAVFNLNFLCGILLLVCICLNCCLSIVHHRVLLSAKKPKLTLICCVVVWTLSLVLSFPDCLFNADFTEVPLATTLCICSHQPVGWQMSGRILYHVLGFVLPTAALIVCCSWVLLQLNRSVKGFQQHRHFLTVTALVVVFLLCWAPHNIALIASTHVGRHKEDSTSGGFLESAIMVTSVFGCIHACLRPVLYFGLSANFRTWCVSMLRCTVVDMEGSLCELGFGDEACADRRQQEKQQEEEEQRVPMTDCVIDQHEQKPSAPF